jgi:hypothetical protein
MILIPVPGVQFGQKYAGMLREVRLVLTPRPFPVSAYLSSPSSSPVSEIVPYADLLLTPYH